MSTDEQKFDLITLWEGEGVLYAVNHAEYHDENKRNAATKRIAEEMGISEESVTNMLKNLRTQFLKEKRKVECSKGTGKGRKQLYVPKWKFYDALAFLLPYTKSVKSVSNKLQQIAEEESDQESDEEEVNNENVNYENIEPSESGAHEDSNMGEVDDTEEDTQSVEAQEEAPPPKKLFVRNPFQNQKNKKKKTTADDLILQATNVLASVTNNNKKSPATPKTPQRAIPDMDIVDELFGTSIARQVANIKDPMLKEAAKIECQQVVFKYRFQSEQNVKTTPYTSFHNHSYSHSQNSASYQQSPKNLASYPQHQTGAFYQEPPTSASYNHSPASYGQYQNMSFQHSQNSAPPASPASYQQLPESFSITSIAPTINK